MGQLLRGPQERFNPQIHTEGNSLTTLMAKHNEVARKTFDLFSRYTRFTSWMTLSGRINQGARAGKVKKSSMGISDNAYRIAYKGMDILPAYATGDAVFGGYFDAAEINPDLTSNGITYVNGLTAGTVATNTKCSVAVKHDPTNNILGDKFNPNDRVTLGPGGVTIIFQKKGRLASTSDHYVYDGVTVGPAAAFQEAHLADGVVLTEAGNVVGEGSLKGYQRTSRNKWKINYTWVSRYTLTMTGSAKSQKVASIYNSDSPNSKSWEFEAVIKADEYHRIFNEQGLRYSRTSMDPTSHSWYENWGVNKLTLDGFLAESGLEAPITGDGWIPQIEDNATIPYNPNTGLEASLVEAFTNILSTRSPAGQEGNIFFGVTDRIGRTAFETGMKKLIQFNANDGNSGATNIVYDVTTKEALELGFSITKYHYLGNTFCIMEDELLGHPGLYSTNGGLVGTGNIYVLNGTSVNGVPNFELFSRAEREYRKKFVDGMHSISKAETSHAASGFDGAQMHILSELMPILYDDRSCGVLKASAAYTGGALVGNALATDNASTFIY